MPDTPQLLADLERRLDHALQTCGASPEPGLLSITLAAPALHFDRLPPGLSDYVYWALFGKVFRSTARLRLGIRLCLTPPTNQRKRESHHPVAFRTPPGARAST